MPRGRVRIVNGTVVSDCGSLLRGGVAKVYALGKQNGKTAYATDPAYYRQLRNARLNAVRIACLDPWRRTHDQVHWDLTQSDDRAAFLSELDSIVELAAAHELYALIDYHDVGTYNLAYLECFWELVAPRYASLRHVFYELANEPVAWSPEDYTDQALSEQQRLFGRVRQLAPETHVVLLSFANTAHDLVPQGNPMLDVVDRMSGVDWSNASVSFHPYRTLSSQIIVALRERVPVLSTELDLPAHARFSDEPHIYVSMDGAEYAHQALERIGVSWFGWEIEGPRKLEKYFRRGVLMDASIKGYLWKPDWPLRKSLADYSSIARFFREYPVLEAMREMGLEWGPVAGLLRLGCVAAFMEGIMLWAPLPLSKGVLEGNFQFFWRSAALSRLRPYVPQGAQSVTGTLVVFALGLFLVGLIRNGALYALDLSAGRYYGLYSTRLADFTFRRYLTFGKAYFDRCGTWKPAAAIDSHQLFLKMLRSLLEAMLATPLVIVYFAVMTSISWPASLIVLLLLPALYCCERWIANRAVQKNTDFDTGDAREHAVILEEGRRSDLRARRLDAILPRARDVSILVAVLLIIVLAMVTSGGRPPILALFLSCLIAGLALRRFNTFLEVEFEFSKNLPALREFFDIFNNNGKYILPGGRRPFVGLAESVEFRRLTFSYPDQKPVLHDVSFSLRKGEMTVLIGPTGAGKSTLAALLARDYDVPPRTILLDGVSIREFTPSSLRQNIALVSQNIPLLDDTLKNNLIFGLPGAVSNCDLTRAVAEASLDEWVESLPDGLETKLGAGGVMLSSGQRQRVALARTLLQRASIVIVDAADALDSETERRRESPLECLTRDCTWLVITGRMSTIKRAHNVVVLDNGRVIEEGSPRDLLVRRGRLFQMWAGKQLD